MHHRQHAASGPGMIAGDADHLHLVRDVERRDRFIQEQPARPVGTGGIAHLKQHAGQLNPLLFAARKLLIEPGAVVAQPDLGQGMADRHRVAGGGAAQAHDLGHGEGEGQRRGLRQHPAHPRQFMRRHARQVAPAQTDRAGMADLSGQGAQEGRLARSVGPDDAGHLPRRRPHVDAVEDRLAPKLHADIAGGEAGFGRRVGRLVRGRVRVDVGHQGHRSSAPFWRKRIHRKIGAPRTAVTIPMGSSDGAMIVRDTISASSSSVAPSRAELTSRCR